LDVIHRSNHCLQRVLFEVDFLHNKRSLSDAHFKSFSFASVATATQIIIATLPLYSQNATWRSSTANTAFFVLQSYSFCTLLINEIKNLQAINF
jgi:hypothetical protein